MEITERKFADEQIIKALECCSKDGGPDWCSECPLAELKCAVLLPQNALDLIKRLKAQNEKWQELALKQEDTAQMLVREHQQELDEARAEIARLQKYNTDVAFKHYNDGIKEFARKFKLKMLHNHELISYTAYRLVLSLVDILTAEMTGGNNENIQEAKTK